ncbi:hypothetical protein LCGC14_0606610 [marine sediment metagenome]|uniref:Uncharacterized protein n=1 Tax=marine sediment metagenome TaxID=412755 RepID=A0A0F9TV75_9ZZZZ|nr:hypothetical protein [bacterium]
MRRIYKWRWSIVILLTIITITGTVITFYYPIAIFIAIGLDELVSQIYRLIFVPRLKEIEDKEKEKKSKQKKYDPIKKIIELLENYENIKNDEITEKKYTMELLELFEKLILIGFGKTEPQTFEDNNYSIHITTAKNKQFYIKDQTNKNMYYSKQYEQETIVHVLSAFIIYMKNELNRWINSSNK